MLRFSLQWLSPPAPFQEGPFRSFMAILHVSRAVHACRGPVPGKDHLFASVGTSHLEQAEKHPVWKLGLMEEYRKAQHFGEGCLMLVYSPGIWVYCLTLQKASRAASGRSLHLGAWFLPCNGESNPIHQLPVIKDAQVPWGGGQGGPETHWGPTDQLHEGPDSSSRQPQAAAGK